MRGEKLTEDEDIAQGVLPVLISLTVTLFFVCNFIMLHRQYDMVLYAVLYSLDSCRQAKYNK